MESKLKLLTKIFSQKQIFKQFKSVNSSSVVSSKLEELELYEERLVELHNIFLNDGSIHNWKLYASIRAKVNSQKAAIKRHIIQQYKIKYITKTIKLNKITADYSLIQFLAKFIDGKILDKNIAKTLVSDRTLHKDNKITYDIQFDHLPDYNKAYFKLLKNSFETGYIYIKGKKFSWLPLAKPPEWKNP